MIFFTVRKTNFLTFYTLLARYIHHLSIQHITDASLNEEKKQCPDHIQYILVNNQQNTLLDQSKTLLILTYNQFT